MTALRIPRRMSAGRIRQLQRGFHLLTGLALIAYVYAAPAPDSPLATAVRWLVLPAVVTSGAAMWQWPRLRRLVLRSRRRA